MSRPPKRSARPTSRGSTPTPAPRLGAAPTQRQLRAGELVRHALVEILRAEAFADPVLAGVSVTLTEVRMAPDLRHALCFVVPLGGAQSPEVVAGLNRASRFLRGQLGRAVDLRFTPDLKFVRDDSFDEAARMGRLFADPKIQRDLQDGGQEGAETPSAENGDSGNAEPDDGA